MVNIVKNKLISLIVTIIIGTGVVIKTTTTTYASCNSMYGGGENCTSEKELKITKEVAFEDDDDYGDKLVLDKDENDKVIVFKIKVKNTGDVTIDDLNIKDRLPDELKRVGGSGLTEDLGSLKPGETKDIKIKVKIDADEFDRDVEFEKCVVNKASVYENDEFKGADTATVCYGNADLKELPDTGADYGMVLGLFGFASTCLGVVLNRKYA